ncbi:MAG: hypothetical protein JWN84_3477, partial [Nocardioides sp.]|nr:hypothetical protein [Nocardioides sp.]
VARVVAAADAARAAADQRSSEPAEPVEAPRPSRALESLVIQDVADFAAVAAQVAHLEAEEASRVDAAEVARLEAETEAAASAAEAALARVAAIDTAVFDSAESTQHSDGATDYGFHGDFDDDLSDLEAPEHVRHPSDAPLRSVTEVADTVIAAMRRINEAHDLHVESLELETARRCELLTAQAELDAELIRLHARREAHAIITAARTRSGEHDAGTVESDQLGEIGETFSRFAETIETTVAPGPGSPDHLRKS